MHHGYFDPAACDLIEFDQILNQETGEHQLVFAAEIIDNIPVYDVSKLGRVFDIGRLDLMAEWAWVLRDGAGVFVLRNAYPDAAPVDAATDVFHRIIAHEKAASGGGADHFAAAGANDRIWNSAQKLCLAAPDVFATYFGNHAIATACEAWLGPGYQMTSQVNLVRPGGQAQSAHRDYHLGFQTSEKSALFPSHAHLLSPYLTLQGAVAHTDMPVESGPTKLLPFSQLYDAGYVAFTHPDFREVFDTHHVQLPLTKGDAVFFNPALFHAAGENRTTDIHRMANLLQVSSPMGRAMEAMDRIAMASALYPALQSVVLSPENRDAAVAACAEGYPFPTNLDTDPPTDGLAPETQADLMRRALGLGWGTSKFITALTAQRMRQQAQGTPL